MRNSLLLLVIVLMAGVMGVAFASAADLTVRGGTIQAGTTHVLKSDENGVWATDWGLNPAHGLVYDVSIGSFEEDNFGNSVLVVITDIDHEEIARSEATIDAAWMILPFDHPVNPSDIFDLHVYLEGFSIPSGATNGGG